MLGGGYIGLEFGQMFRRFGSRVTIVQRGERLLAREDAGIATDKRGNIDGDTDLMRWPGPRSYVIWGTL